MPNSKKIYRVGTLFCLMLGLALLYYRNVPVAIGQSDVYLPIVQNMPILAPTATPTVTSDCVESEPNNRQGDADGPVLSGQRCHGLHDNNNDFYYFNVTETSLMNLELFSFYKEGPQLQLYCESVSHEENKVFDETGGDRLHENCVLKGGHKYLIYIYTPSDQENDNQPYHFDLTLEPTSSDAPFCEFKDYQCNP